VTAEPGAFGLSLLLCNHSCKRHTGSHILIADGQCSEGMWRLRRQRARSWARSGTAFLPTCCHSGSARSTEAHLGDSRPTHRRKRDGRTCRKLGVGPEQTHGSVCLTHGRPDERWFRTWRPAAERFRDSTCRSRPFAAALAAASMSIPPAPVRRMSQPARKGPANRKGHRHASDGHRQSHPGIRSRDHAG